MQISYEQINSIQVKAETKQNLRYFIDQLYEEYVGIHLKSKKFIDDMQSWSKLLMPKADEKKEPNEE